jgi:predicted transcriptional regulator
MIQKGKKTEIKAQPASPTTMPVTLRVRRDHLEELDKIAHSKGIIRSAAIQIAIAEFIERKGKYPS